MKRHTYIKKGIALLMTAVICFNQYYPDVLTVQATKELQEELSVEEEIPEETLEEEFTEEEPLDPEEETSEESTEEEEETPEESIEEEEETLEESTEEEIETPEESTEEEEETPEESTEEEEETLEESTEEETETPEEGTEEETETPEASTEEETESAEEETMEEEGEDLLMPSLFSLGGIMLLADIKQDLTIRIDYGGTLSGDLTYTIEVYDAGTGSYVLYSGEYSVWNASDNKLSDGYISGGSLTVSKSQAISGGKITIPLLTGTKVRVTQTGPSGMSRPGTPSEGTAGDEIKDIVNAETADVVLAKKWNDNGDYSRNRPAASAYSSKAKLYFQIEGATAAELTDATKDQVGLSSLPSRVEDTVAGAGTWTYTYKDLPQHVKVGSEWKTITWSFVEDTVTGYQAQQDDPTTITNTEQYDFSSTVVWQDSGYTSMRPAKESWETGMKVYGYTSSPDASVEYTATVTVTEVGSDLWTLNVSGLPKYDASGKLLHYYLVPPAFEPDADGHTYSTMYKNEGIYTSREDKLFEEGQMVNTITKTGDFYYDVKWKDGSTSPESRPEGKLYLYRYLVGENPKTASPVQGEDNQTIWNDDMNGEKYNLSGLPLYDSLGRKYVYVLKEKLTDAGDYKITYYDSEGHPTDYLCMGGKVVNKLEGTVDVPVKKIWDAKALQGFGSRSPKVTFKLQSSSDGGSTWSDVLKDGNMVTKELGPFSAEAMTLEDIFEDQPKYDEAGKLLTYRCREVSVSIDGTNTYYVTEDGGNLLLKIPGIGPSGTTAIFRVQYDGADGSCTNQLVSETKVSVNKTWYSYVTHSSEAPAGAQVTVTLKRSDGLPAVYLDGTPVGTMVLSGSTWEGEFTNLPLYGTDGKEITYTIEEAVTGADGYTKKVSYLKVTEELSPGETTLVTKVSLSNVEYDNGTAILQFEVEKEWLDDGDLLHRAPVQVGVAKKADVESGDVFNADGSVKKSDLVTLHGSGTAKTVELDAAHLWQDVLTITKEGSNTQEDYVLLEVAIQEAGGTWTPVKYREDAKHISNYNGSTVLGDMDSQEHLYDVFIEKSTSGKYQITNLRTGEISIRLDKTWKVGDKKPQAKFQIYRNGAAYGEPIVLDLAVSEYTKTVSNLPKYDENGVVYTYTVQETAISLDDGSSWISFEDGVAVVSGDRYVSSVVLDHTDYGATQHTGDKIFFKSENRLSQTMEPFVINKVWQDDGTASGNVIRPDIYFQLYRTTAYTSAELIAMSESELAAKVGTTVEKLPKEYIWDTKKNDWYWISTVDDVLPRYDEDGNEYIYFVREGMRQTSEYTAYYDNAHTDVSPVAGLAHGDDTSKVWTYTYSGSGDTVLIVHDKGDTGTKQRTVVNVRSGTRTGSGMKRWTNLPGSFDKTKLPNLTMVLYRSIIYKTNEEIREHITSGGTDGVEKVQAIDLISASDIVTFNFGSLEKYDAYGRTYYYYVKEYLTSEYGGVDTNTVPSIPGYESNVSESGNAFTWYNNYDEEVTIRTRAEIKVTKTWKVEMSSGLSGYFADTKFQLWRTLTDGSCEEQIAEMTLKGPDIVSAGDYGIYKTATLTGTFKRVGENTSDGDGSGEYLAYYAPDGKPYKYYLKEVVPGGYQGTYKTSDAQGGTIDNVLTGDKLELLPTGRETAGGELREIYSNTVEADSSFTNTYNGKPYRSVDAQKVWNDQSDRFGYRPSSGNFTFKLSRKTETLAEETSLHELNDWKNTGTDVWTCEFARDKNDNNLINSDETGLVWESYAPDGTKYVYQVNQENAASDLAESFTSYDQQGLGTTKVTNSVATMDLTVYKKWKGDDNGTGDGILNDEQIKQLFSLGAFPDKIKFIVQYQDSGSDTWVDLKDKSGNVIQQEVILDTVNAVMDIRDDGYTFLNLPQYAKGKHTGDSGNTRKYRIVETIDGGASWTVDNWGASDDTNPGIDASAETEITVTNTIPLRKLYVSKEWNDYVNRDQTRPASGLTFTITRDGESSKKLDVKLDKSMEANDTGDKPNLWVRTAPIYVPLYKDSSGSEYSSYSVTEESLADYTTVTDSDGYPKKTNDVTGVPDGNKNDFRLKNTLTADRKTINITATKTWNDDPWGSVTRPQHITYTLEVWNGTDWEKATIGNSGLYTDAYANPQTVTVLSDGTANAEWKYLWQYKEHESTDPLSMRYRVVEEIPAAENKGLYTTSYSDGTGTYYNEIEASSVLTGTSKNITVKNTLVKDKKATIKKLWKPDEFFGSTITASDIQKWQDAGIIPVYIRFGVYYTTNSDPYVAPDSDWIRKDQVQYSTAEQIKNLWVSDIPYSFPATDKDDHILYYKYVEEAVKFKGDTTERTVTSPSLYDISYHYEYTAGTDSSVITNQVYYGSITVTKTAEDEADRDGLRGDIEIQLLRNGTVWTNGTLTWNSITKSWNPVTFDYFPVYSYGNDKTKDDSKNQWTVQEVDSSIPAGYTAAYTYEGGSTYIQLNETTGNSDNKAARITNTRVPDTFSVKATKSWLGDHEDAMGTRPVNGKVTVTLKYSPDSGAHWNTVEKAEKVSTKADFSDPSKVYYCVEDSSYYKYDTGESKWKQDGMGVYTTDDPVQTITETYPEVDWSNLRVYRNGDRMNAIQYQVEEPPVSGYTTSYSVTGGTEKDPAIGSFTSSKGVSVSVKVKNTLKTCELTVRKQWDGDDSYTSQIRSPKIVYKIEYRVGSTGAWTNVPDSYTGLADSHYLTGAYDVTEWGAKTYAGLPVQNSSGVQYEYRVQEVSLVYTDGSGIVYASGSWDSGTGRTWTGIAGAYEAQAVTEQSGGDWAAVITNTLPTVSVSMKKDWDDNYDRDGTRENITFKLYRDDALWDGTKQATTDDPNTVEWTGLPKYKTKATAHDASNESDYQVEEDTSVLSGKGYTTSPSGKTTVTPVSSPGTITNIYTAKSFTITADKVWSENLYGMRPGNVIFTLYASVWDASLNGGLGEYKDYEPVTHGSYTGSARGAYTTSSVTQTTSHDDDSSTPNVWEKTVKWENLPAYSDGKLIRYQVRECDGSGVSTVPSGYHVAYSYGVIGWIAYDGNTEVNTQVTNTTNGSLTVAKVWEDDSDMYHSRPDSIQVQLQCRANAADPWTNVSTGGTADLTSGGSWSHTFTNLPTHLQYRAIEVSMTYSSGMIVVAYDTSGGLTDQEHGTVGSYVYESITTESGSDAGVYTTTLTNRLPAAGLTVTKVWDDDGNRDGIRPDSVTVRLKRDGVDCGMVTLNADNSWSHTWMNLPLYQNGKPASEANKSVYTIEEVSVPIGYTVSCEYNAGTSDSSISNTVLVQGVTKSASVINTHYPDTFGITAKKSWSGDDRNRWNTRPESVIFTLQYSVDSGMTWTDVPENTSGYVPGVTPAVTENPKTVSTVPLLGWTFSQAEWNDLPCHYWDGTASQQIQYRVVETPVASYTASYSQTTVTGADGSARSITVTNTLQDTSLRVEKYWDDQSDVYGLRPDKVKLQLQRRVGEGAWENVLSREDSQTLNEENSWVYVYEHLSKYADADNTIEYEYRAVEEQLVYKGLIPLLDHEVDAADPDSAGKGRAGAYAYQMAFDSSGSVKSETITNTLETTQLSVEKLWDDEDNGRNTRPASNLGVKLQRTTLTAPTEADWEDLPGSIALALREKDLIYDPVTETWSPASFTELPKADRDGNVYQYRAVEKEVPPGYKASIAVTDNAGGREEKLTNTLELINLSGSIYWYDDSNRYGHRPDSVELTVWADGVEILYTDDLAWTKTGDVWHYSYKNLLRYHPGTNTEIVYKVTQVKPDKYDTDWLETYGTVDEDGNVTLADFIERLKQEYYPSSRRKKEEESPTSQDPEQTGLVKTGDTFEVWFYLVLAFLASGGIFSCFCRMRRPRRKR